MVIDFQYQLNKLFGTLDDLFISLLNSLLLSVHCRFQLQVCLSMNDLSVDTRCKRVNVNLALIFTCYFWLNKFIKSILTDTRWWLPHQEHIFNIVEIFYILFFIPPTLTPKSLNMTCLNFVMYVPEKISHF